jgi:thioredoxin 1
MIKEIGDGDFNDEIMNSDKPVVVDFWANWCTPCKRLEKVIEEVAEKYGDEVNFRKVDVINNQKITSKYGVKNIPHLLFIRKGKVIDRTAGSISRDILEKKLDTLVESA